MPIPMSLPAIEQENPRDVAVGATVSGRFHDAVVSLSKAIHGLELKPEDEEALRWARNLLRSAGVTRTIVTMPTSKELTSQANPVSILKRAVLPAAGEDPVQTFRALSKSLTDVLNGQRSDSLSRSLESVRTIFSKVSQMVHKASVSRKTEQAPVRIWPDLTTTSIS